MKLIFWIVIAFDVAVLMLLFVLGLAAAPSSRTSPFEVAGFMLVIPGLFLTASIVLFTRATSPLLRGVALLLAAAPWLVLTSMERFEAMKVRLNTDPRGKLTFFRAGPVRDMAEAISRNDTATITTLAPKVDLNTRGYSGMTLLMYELRQLRKTPRQIEPLRALIHAGANPNIGTEYELPLETAIELTPKTGPEPVALLLAAGANPNLKTTFGMPIYFTATGLAINTEVLKMLLEHGADIEIPARDGRTAVIQAANSSNWNVVLLLLRRGAVWKGVRAPTGMTLQDMAESSGRVYGDSPGLKEVLEYLRH